MGLFINSGFRFSILAFSLLICRGGMAANCRNLDVSTADDAALLLGRLKPDTTDPNEKQCIEIAIHLVSERRSSKDIEILLPYLSFERLLTPEEQKGFYLHPVSPHSQFPAVGALAIEGKPARGPLLSTIATSDSQLVRQNATAAMTLTYERESGATAVDAVAALRDAAVQAKDQNTVSRFSEAIQYVLTLNGCIRLKGQCERAVANPK